MHFYCNKCETYPKTGPDCPTCGNRLVIENDEARDEWREEKLGALESDREDESECS
jgi:hypothetical protein